MVNQSAIGSLIGVGGGSSGGDPIPGEAAGHYRTITISSADGGVYVECDIPPAFLTDIATATFSIMIRITPETGTTIPSWVEVMQQINTGVSECVVSYEASVSTYYGEAHTILKKQFDIYEPIYTGGGINGSTKFGIFYYDLAYNPITIQPGRWYRFETNVALGDTDKCIIRANGANFLPTIHTTTVAGLPTYTSIVAGKMRPFSLRTGSTIPLKIDIASVYGHISSTPDPTNNVTELLEPLMDYTTADVLYSSAENESKWLINLNSTTDPLGNIGIAPATCTLVSATGTPTISLVEEAPTLNKIPDGSINMIICNHVVSMYTTNVSGYTNWYYYNMIIRYIDNYNMANEKCFIVSIFDHYKTDDLNFCCIQNSIAGGGATNVRFTGSRIAKTYGSTQQYYEAHTAAPQTIRVCTLKYQSNSTNYTYSSKNKTNVSTTASNMATSDWTYSWPTMRCCLPMDYHGKVEAGKVQKFRYFAIYEASAIDAHPEIPWGDKALMENYFYVNGNQVVRDLQNAIPGVTPLVIYDSHSYRNLGLSKGRSEIGYCPAGQYSSGSISYHTYIYWMDYNQANAYNYYYTIPVNHHLLEEMEPNEFIVQL